MTALRFMSSVAAMALALAVAGCGDDEAKDSQDGAEVTREAAAAAVQSGADIDPTTYAGTFQIKTSSGLPVGDKTVPVVVYAGLSAETETRLGVNVFADLRSLQSMLPEILTGPLEETCRRQISLDFHSAEAEATRVRATGSVLARFTTCNRRDPAGERPGITLLSQRVGAVAVATAEVRNDCVEFSLIDVEVDPSGLLGGLANLFGVTELARSVILEKGGAYLRQNPLCPTLPRELTTLEPRYDAGFPQEIGDGGLGAGLSGSIDTSAETLIDVLAFMKDRGILEGQQ